MGVSGWGWVGSLGCWGLCVGWDWLGVYFFVWGVGFTGALGVGCYLCVMSAWGLGGEVVGAYLGAACFDGGVVSAGGVCAGGEVGALVDAVDSFAGEGLGGCGRRVLGEVGHSGVVWGYGGSFWVGVCVGLGWCQYWGWDGNSVVLAASAVVVCVRMSWGVVWYGSLVWGLCWCGGLG